MRCKVLFMTDNVNHKGGAHFATLGVISLLHEHDFDISVFTGYPPDEDIRRDFPYVSFITPMNNSVSDTRSLLRTINAFDIVCVPFEDSIFRKPVSMSDAYKIQWIHIDYKVWKDATPYARKVSKDDRQVYAAFDKIIFVSKACEKGFITLYPELGDKTCVCYNMQDTDKIKALADAPCNDDTGIDSNSADRDIFTIATVTRMSNLQKGITRTLELIEKLKNEGYDFKWVFVGDGVDYDALRRYSKALNLESHAEWTGFTGNPYRYMKNADLSALFSHYEGNPLVIYESLTVGTPVISTYYNTDENYVPGGTGWYVENNFDAIYEGMKHLLDNRELVSEAKARLSSYEYDVQECRERILEVFREGAE